MATTTTTVVDLEEECCATQDKQTTLTELRDAMTTMQRDMATMAIMMRQQDRDLAMSMFGFGPTTRDWPWPVRVDVSRACTKVNQFMMYLTSFGYQKVRGNLYRYVTEDVNIYPDIRLTEEIDPSVDFHPEFFNHIYLNHIVLKKRASVAKGKLTRALNNIKKKRIDGDRVRTAKQHRAATLQAATLQAETPRVETLLEEEAYEEDDLPPSDFLDDSDEEDEWTASGF